MIKGENRVIYVEMSDGTWSIPAKVVADNMAKYYSRDNPEGYDEEYEFMLSSDDDEIIEWAVNNMNWEDVKGSAAHVSDRPPPDYEAEWMDCPKYVEG